MRLTSRIHRDTNQFKTYPFVIKKNRKGEIEIVSPPIIWKDLTAEQARYQWMSCMNTIWEKEKESNVNKDDFAEFLYKLLNLANYKKEDIQAIKRIKDNMIPASLYYTSFLLYKGALYADAHPYFVRTVKDLIRRGKEIPVSVESRPVVKDNTVSTIIEEIMDMEDNMFKKKIDFVEWIKTKNITKDHAKAVAKPYRHRLEECFQIHDGKDEQLNEAYRKFSKPEKIYMLKWYIALVKALDSIEAVVVQRVRKSKPKTPDKIVKNIKYMASFVELGIKSINPEKIIGSGMLWLYNTRLRKLVYYQAKEGYSLSVEGTTLINWHETESKSKTLRKPEIQMKEFLNGSKKVMIDYFNKIKSKDSAPSGRINRDMVILKTY